MLPRARALVHHGGIGTTAQALAAGVPQLIMPLGFDQFDNAARCRTLGVSTALVPRRFTGSNVAQEAPNDDYLRLGPIAAKEAAKFSLHLLKYL